MQNKSEDIIKRYEDLKGQQLPIQSTWQEIAELMVFRKSNILSNSNTPEEASSDKYDFCAMNSNLILASGQLAYVAPADENWFAFDTMDKNVKDNPMVSDFFHKSTEIAKESLATSNFYLELHENLIDRGAFAVGCLFVDYDEEQDNVTFTNIDIGTYVIAEDNKGYVDTVIREFELSAVNAMDKFGEENVSNKIKTCAKDKPDEKFKFLHCVKPNADYKKGKIDEMRFSSVYVSMDDKKIISEGGYREMPYIVSRFLKMDNSPYGYGPGIQSLPLMRQINQIEKDLDILGEKHANPPILAPDLQAYDIDSSAGGITLYDASNPNNAPKEWQNTGRYDVGIDRAEYKRRSIKEAFYVPMFQMMQMQEGTKTATEVMALEAEKLITFSPTFARLTSELLTPLLTRVFGLLFRNGKLPELPDGITKDTLKVSYNSKIALALKTLQTGGFMQFMQNIGVLAQFDPTVLDYIDTNKATKDIAKNMGVSSEWLRDSEEVDQIRQARAEAQQAAAAQEQGMEIAQQAMANPEGAQQLGDMITRM